ncbi:MAG: TIGR03013 family PEP-CTERM/XrtA system glycosyltransferase [Gammaproteobacteria bacterium]|nr:TIGR03013 family PEP-CTERM/XrtA system glycosyltransferase [Gammaproteobacteria bacterium]
MVKFFKHHIPTSEFIKTIFEFAILLVSIPFAIYLTKNDLPDVPSLLTMMLIYSSVVFLIMVSLGLYNRHLRDSINSSIIRAILTFVLAAVIMSSIFYALPHIAISRRAFTYAILISLAGILFSRTSCYFLLANNLIYRKKILVYGAGHRASLISDLKRKSDIRHFNCIGYVPVEGENIKIDASRLINIPDSLYEYVVNNKVDEIIVALDDKRKSLPIRDLLDCKLYGVQIDELSTFFEKHIGRIKLQSVHPSNLVFSNGFMRSYINERTKRVLDLIAAISLFLLVWPIMLITCLAIMLESGFKAPILYRQTRVGQNNETFDVIKFRSMGVNAEKDGAVMASTNDNRVTKVGAFIRKVRIDELPQLWNVIKGEMSFVGPRPERPEFVNQFSDSIQFYEVRHFVKPGLTGWAQICYPYGSNEEDTKNKLEYDLYYLKNYSLFLDLMIILHTIQVVLWKQGAK